MNVPVRKRGLAGAGLWGQQIWKEMHNRVQQESESMVVFHVGLHFIKSRWKQEADTSTKAQAISPEVLWKLPTRVAIKI